MDTNQCIGRRIKYFRKQKGLKQRELAEMLGISLSYMSQLESGKSNINVSMLLDIANFLELPSITMLVEDNPRNEVSIIRSVDRCLDVRSPEKITIDMLLATYDSQLEVSMVYLPFASNSNKAHMHRGNEFCFVVCGQVMLSLGGKGEYDLKKGDIAAYPAELPHCWKNIGEGDAELLLASTPVSFI